MEHYLSWFSPHISFSPNKWQFIMPKLKVEKVTFLIIGWLINEKTGCSYLRKCVLIYDSLRYFPYSKGYCFFSMADICKLTVYTGFWNRMPYTVPFAEIRIWKDDIYFKVKCIYGAGAAKRRFPSGLHLHKTLLLQAINCHVAVQQATAILIPPV